MLLGETRNPVRFQTSRLENIFTWTAGGRIPPLPVEGGTVSDLRLVEPVRVEKHRLGLADLRLEILELANTSKHYENGTGAFYVYRARADLECLRGSRFHLASKGRPKFGTFWRIRGPGHICYHL